MTSLPQAARIRRMTPADLDRVMEIAASLPEAPQWPRSAYVDALDEAAIPQRIALVIENPAGAKAQRLLSAICGPTKVVPLLQNLPKMSFFAACKAQAFNEPSSARLKSCPDASGHLSSFSASDAENGGVKVGGLAENEGVAIAGFAVASLLPPEAELELIAVDPAAQRRGLACRLFAALAAELSAAQAKEMILEVRASNLAALALYRKLGFVESGRRKDYYQIPVEDALLMRLGL